MSFKLTDFNERTQKQIQRLLDDVSARYSRQVAELESNPSHAPLEAKEVQGSDRGRFLVRVTTRRKRLIDEDNLCEKYHVDLCRYAGVLFDDAPERTKIEVSQAKCKKGEPEEITIEVFQT
jgi:hypothetical protein